MTPRGSSDSLATLAAIILLACAGAESLGLAPFIVSVLTTVAHLTTEQAGQCVSAEFAGNVLGALCVVALAGRSGKTNRWIAL